MRAHGQALEFFTKVSLRVEAGQQMDSLFKKKINFLKMFTKI
jgi:hypothetical protein